MTFNIGGIILHFSGLVIFWVVTVTFSFNIAYFLFLWDRKGQTAASRSRARVLITVFVGTLIVIGTYADTLANKQFALKDCLLLALVAAHGWMAEELVDKFLKRTRTGRQAIL